MEGARFQARRSSSISNAFIRWGSCFALSIGEFPPWLKPGLKKSASARLKPCPCKSLISVPPRKSALAGFFAGLNGDELPLLHRLEEREIRALRILNDREATDIFHRHGSETDVGPQ